MLRTLVGLMVLIPAMLGYMFTITSRYRVPFSLVPAITFTGIAVVMFFCGILNVMRMAVVLVCLVGLILFVYGLVRWKFLPKITFSMVVFLLLLVYLLWFCYGAVYADGDTMTHWGVVVREMVIFDRFPNFSTQEVGYQSYPTGSASFIYFFCTVLGYSEPITLFAQGLLVVACLLTVSSAVKKGDIWGMGLFLFFLAFTVQFNIRLDDLKVDHLLSVLCIAAIAVTVYYRNDALRAAFLVSPILCLLTVTKSSGVFFALIGLLPLLYALKQQRPNRRALLTIGAFAVVLPALMIILWNAHTDLVFLSADETRHAASLTYMRWVFRGKSTEELALIQRNFMDTWLSLDRLRNASGEWTLLGAYAVLLLGGNLYRRVAIKEKSWVEYGIFFASLACYLGYKLALLGMYLFNMPGEDAVIIGSYSRYTSSITVILYAVMLMYALFLLSKKQTAERPTHARRAQNLVLSVVVVVCMAAFPAANPASLSALARPNYAEDGCYRRLVQIKQAYNLPPRDGRILVYTTTPYARFYVKYCFRSVDAVCVEADQLETRLDDRFDYLIVMEHNDQIDSALDHCGLPVTLPVIVLDKPSSA